jgi:hypothetical protein
MPWTVPGISFNDEGVCNYCQQYQPETYLGGERLNVIIKNAKIIRDGDYDCIVPISGGRDSTYILYLAKKIFGMRVLAVNYDNEFAPPFTVRNMKRACEILNVDHVSVRSKRAYVRKIAKHSMLAATEFGQFGECVGCTYGYRSVVYRKAREYKIPLIIWGESKEEATAGMELKAFEPIRRPDLKYRKLLKKDYYAAEYYRFLQRVEFFLSWKDVFSRSFDPMLRDDGIQQIRIFDYISWDRTKIKEIIMDELQWEKPAELATTWRADCALVALTNYSYIKLFGCTKLCFGYTKMINGGKMDRGEALAQEEYMLANCSRGLEEVLRKSIGLRAEHANRILSFPDGNYYPHTSL